MFADEGVLEDILHYHSIVRVLLHNAQNEVFCIITHINVLRKLHFIFHLNQKNGTMRLRSNSEYMRKGILPTMHS